MTDALDETFAGPTFHPSFRWRHEPVRWSVDPAGRCLRIESEAGTDFWSRTHYGFEADNGHFLFTERAGDFVMTTRVRFRPLHQYDQAGLMVRVSSDCWIKTSVEYEPSGPSCLGAVVTQHGYSDWSMQPFPASAREVWLRVRREGQDYLVDASRNGRDWAAIRLAHLHQANPNDPVRCGLYACSPKGGGFIAEFCRLKIDPGRLL